MTSPQHIETSRHDGVQVIRFNRPDKKNALTNAMYHQVADAMQDAESDDTIGAHLFVGAGGVFTSGNDIADFASQGQGQVDPGERGVRRFLMLQIDAKKPLVAAVDGLAVGIGTTLLMQCDLVYASDRARLQTPFVDLGLITENASSLLAPRIMGHQRAFALLCLGEAFSGEQAMAAGLVNAVFPAAELEDKALAAAVRLAAKPREAMRLTRALLRGDPETIRARSNEEGELFWKRLQSDEAKQAFANFLARKR